ncbi:MAG: response regulator [Thermoplasmatota archaeon]
MKVLFVDDDEDVRKQAKMFLEEKNEDLELDISGSYRDAINKLNENDFDAIVSDYHMPKKNGIHLLRYKNEKDIDLPFILFTGKGEEKVAMKALNYGADRYVIKEEPVSKMYTILARAIKREVERKTLERDLNRSYKLIQKTLDSLPTAVVILDGDGNIIRKNDAWSNLAEINFMISDHGIGENYFEIIKSTVNESSEEVKETYDGLMSLKDDKEDVFSMEYTLTDKKNKKKYLMRGTKFYLDSKEFLVISHLDITKEN